MMLFLIETGAIVVAVVGTMATAYVRARDPLHPAFVLGPMLLFLYVGVPLYLLQGDGFFGYLTDEQAVFAQAINLAGVCALCGGILVGGRGVRFAEGACAAATGARVEPIAFFLGAMGLAGFVAGILGVGGFENAYGRGYGGGWSDSGYARELYHLTISAILLLFATGEVGRRGRAWLWIGLFAAPFLIHGTLGARRGPTFVIVVAVVAGSYLMRRTRPALGIVLAGGAALGVLLLVLVSNREHIYIGSDFELSGNPKTYIDAGGGNEFLYGAGAIVATTKLNSFSWGGRYATVLLIRPIPRAFWPTKYEDAARWFGKNIEVNLGIDGDEFIRVLGWRPTIGAAPGIIADMWIEFAWGGLAVLFLIGFAYGRTWRAAVMSASGASLAYAALLCLSLYLVLQTFEAMAFRFLVIVVPAWIALKLVGAARSTRSV